MKVYNCRAMSFRVKKDVVKEAQADRNYMENFGLTVLCPVTEEKVAPSNEILQASYDEMVNYWKRDKELIREADVVFDMTPTMKSEGSSHEIGYSRYYLWKPVVRVYPIGQVPPKSSVAFFEDDLIAEGILEACYCANQLWGTPTKRFIWRAKLLYKCLPKFIKFQLQSWK